MFLINPFAFGSYYARAVTFSNDYLTRGAAFTGAANCSGITFSFWFKPSDTGAGNKIIHTFGATEVEIFLTDADYVRVLVYSSTGATLLDTRTSALTYDVWHHIAGAFDASAGTVNLYVDGASDATTTTATTGTIKFTNSAPFPAFAAAANGANAITADFADAWFSTSYIDLSSAANLAKFRTVGGKPVNLGATGEIPTGSAPILYLSKRDGEATTDFATNKGTGGGMTINGSLSSASTSPSD